WYGVTLRTQTGEAVAMGRVIGDGALVLQIVDIAVLPSWQGRGLGLRIMAALMERIVAEAPGAYVSLIADGPARHLYARFGFAPVAPASEGMALTVPDCGPGA
ncbi:MAG: GNAT family N-acetyltransferase, partial [Pseudomonadota bacterium]